MMPKLRAFAISACVVLSACGGGSSGADQERLADLMTAEESFGFVDEECIRDKTKQLSDEDARILVDNIDAEDVEGLGLSADAEAWIFSLFECMGGEFGAESSDLSEGPDSVANAPAGVSGDRSSPVPAGSIADLGGGWRMQVLGVVDDATAAVMDAAEYNDPPVAGSRYTLVTVALGYYGLASESAPFIGAVGSASTELDSYCGTIPDELKQYERVFAGAVKAGNLCFVTTAADSGSIQLYASSGFSGSDVFLDVSMPAVDPEPMPQLRGVQPGTDDAEARLDPIPIGTQTDIGEGWKVTVASPARDVTDDVLAFSEYNVPPPDGHRFIAFDLSMDYNGAAGANAFEVTVDIVGDSNIAFQDGCGQIPDELDAYVDVFSGATIAGSQCFVVPTEDIGTLVAAVTHGLGDYSFFALE